MPLKCGVDRRNFRVNIFCASKLIDHLSPASHPLTGSVVRAIILVFNTLRVCIILFFFNLSIVLDFEGNKLDNFLRINLFGGRSLNLRNL